MIQARRRSSGRWRAAGLSLGLTELGGTPVVSSQGMGGPSNQIVENG